MKLQLTSLPFRILIVIVGVALFAFYAILFVGAVVNLPVTWFGVVYAAFGLAAAIACFMYFFWKKLILLVVILPAVILMLITLSGLIT